LEGCPIPLAKVTRPWGLGVGLDLNRRLPSQAIHDLDTVIAVLRLQTIAPLSWTDIALDFVIRNSHQQTGLPGMQRGHDSFVLPVSLAVARHKRGRNSGAHVPKHRAKMAPAETQMIAKRVHPPQYRNGPG
jgi:hypothetical protein